MRRFKTLILVSTATLGLTAQEVKAQEAPAQPQTQPGPSDAKPSGEIVITGSRIVRNGYQAPTPTLITTVEALEATSPQSIVQGLEKLPIFAGSYGPGGAPTHGSGSGNANNVGDFLNLRNFGSTRTLILLDGRRVPPTNFDGSVDVDTLPQLFTQRVDIVTGGASAVYGADAVTGVVNYVLDHHYVGLKGTIQSGVSTYGDDASKRANIAYGTNLFGDRGHFETSFEYNETDGIGSKESRPWYQGQFLAGTGSAANPYHTINNGRINNASFGGLITSASAGSAASLVGQTFNPNGTLSPFNVGTASGTNGYSSGGDGAYHQDTSLLASERSYQAFGRFDYKLTDSINFFTQVSFDNSQSVHTQATPNRSTSGTSSIRIYQDNAYLNPAIAAQIPAGGYINVSEYGIDLGRPVFQITTNSIFSSTGLDGKFGTFHWDLTYNFGRGETRNNQYQNSNNQNFYAAVDAVRGPSGNIVCRVSLTQYASLYPGCTPINVLGRGNASAAAIAYTTNLTSWDAVNTTHDVTANLGGDLFSWWAGTVSTSLGAEFRHQSLLETTTDNPNTLPNFTGLRGGFIIPTAASCTACMPASISSKTYTLAYVGTLSAGAQGSQDVWELNDETVIPLLKDLPFAKSLEFSGAARYSHYRTSGGAFTWKLGAEWTPVEGIHFRAVRSRDFRAPTLYDLFAAPQIASQGVTDPLTGVSGYPRAYTEGNPALTPEVAYTNTVGVVLTPGFLQGFSAAIDYYSIKINNAIVSIPLTTEINACTASGGTSPYCAFIQRPINNTSTSAANFPTSYISSEINAAQNSTHGVDFDLTYNRPIANAGRLSLRAYVDYQPTMKIVTFPGAPVLDYAGVGDIGFSKVRWTSQVTFAAYSGFTATVLNRWKSGVHRLDTPTLYSTDPSLGAYDTVDLTLSQDIKSGRHTFQFFVTVDNVLNRAPRIFANTSPGQINPTVADDDVIGRYFVSGVRLKF